MSDAKETKTPGAVRGGEGGRYVFKLSEMKGIPAGTGYSTAEGPVVEGERIQCGLISKKRGTGARPHFHPNEQWNYVVKGTLRVMIGDRPEQLCGPGTLIYIPANTVHATIATQDEDVVFLAVKDMSHGIVGMPADGKPTGGHYDPGYEEKK